MAIAFDVSSIGTYNGTTWTHTCTGNNLYLMVAMPNSSSPPTGVTYAGVSMTLLGNSTDGYLSVWGLYGPATGANSIIMSGGDAGSYEIGVAVSYTGVLQSGQPDSLAKGVTATTGNTVSTTVVASNCWLVGFGSAYSTSLTGYTTGQTNRKSGTYFTGAYYIISDSNGAVSTGSNSVTFTTTGTPTYNDGIILSLVPAPDLPGSFFFAIN